LIVCAAIIRDGKVLLVRHSCADKPDYGDWLLPAGRVKQGESLEEALEREIRKELSLGIRVIKKLAELVDSYTGDRLTIFLCIPLASGVEISSEREEAKWFTGGEIYNLENIHPGLKQLLIDSLESWYHAR